VASGGLIAESLRVGSVLADVRVVVTRISRFEPPNVIEEQAPIWTLMDFETDDADVPSLAEKLEAVLDDNPTVWYCDIETVDETFVVFPRRTFRYPRGDAAGRSEAAEYGRSHGVPESQLDWPEADPRKRRAP
jgi:hypothetical protein